MPQEPSSPPSPEQLESAALAYQRDRRAVAEAEARLGELRKRERQSEAAYIGLLKRRPDPQLLHVVGGEGCRPQSDGKGIHRERIAPAEARP